MKLLLTLWLGVVSNVFATPVPVIRVDDTINVGTARYISKQIAEAESQKAPFLVLELNTEGGTLHATREIVQSMLNATIPIVVYVTPSGGHATSAGTFITLAADVAAMAPGTHIGAAHPVMPGAAMDDVMNEKATNDTAAFAETIAKTRGRNPEWARASVEQSASIPAEEALQKKVIDLVVENRAALFEKLSGFPFTAAKDSLKQMPEGTFESADQPMSLAEKLLAFFAHPQMALWMLSIGGICLWVELTHPGLIFPGVIGGICIILSLISLQMLPIDYGALALLLLGLGLMIAEIFFTSYGVLGIGGLLAFIFGSVFLLDTNVPGFQIGIWDVLPIAVVLAGGVIALTLLVLKSRQRAVQAGTESLIGQFAEVRETVSQDTPGKVFVFGELWKAETLSEKPIPPRSIVVVKEVRNMLLVVEPQAKA
ncbi:MAG: nodulation protein NfeD [Bdellovibrionales bacterium]|nr:nodulation protein NfeD [Bdellovibrionales bacterium]